MTTKEKRLNLIRLGENFPRRRMISFYLERLPIEICDLLEEDLFVNDENTLVFQCDFSNFNQNDIFFWSSFLVKSRANEFNVVKKNNICFIRLGWE